MRTTALKITALLIMSVTSLTYGQKTDTDQLLKAGFKDLKNKKYDAALEKANQGLKLAPDYIDFYVLAGRASQMNGKYDSARYYLSHAIEKNPDYLDAWSYLIEVEIADHKTDKAKELVDKAITKYPGNREFRIKKMEIYQLERDERGEYLYVTELRKSYPNDETVLQRYNFLQSKFETDRVGVNYSYTHFNRDNYGPWHLASAQYIRERTWGSVIGRVSYADRFSNGSSVANGLQYEAETYLFSGKTDYHYGGIAYSDDLVFPQWRAGYSFFHNFKKGWEGDIGLRYTHAGGRDFTTGVIGIGKYIGSYWINVRAFIQNENDSFYPAFTLTSRYYFNTKFDYAQITAGYGTSPDDRTALGQFDQRVALDSYRIGAGYYRLLGQHYLIGAGVNYNRQEYVPGKKQDELELSTMFQYKF